MENISLIKEQCKVLTLRPVSLNPNNGFALLTNNIWFSNCLQQLFCNMASY